MGTRKITILDGGMGRELKKWGAPFKQPEWSALAMMVAPEIVKEVHKAFIASGASVITTNSYALVPFHIGEKRFKDQGKALATCAGKMARSAVTETQTGVRVAGSIPPLFGSYRADLYRSERVVEIASPLIEGLSPYVDLWLCETQSLIDEPIRIKSLIDRLDIQQKPFWVSFTLEDSQLNNEPLLRSGESVVDAVKAMVNAKVDAILFNCCQPEVINQSVKVTQHQLASIGAKNIEIGAYANAFPPQPKDATANKGLNELRADLTPSAYLDWARQWIQDGATLIGGCCGIGPEHIAVLAENLV
ncbi:homocysteine S-methyltransferase [Desulforapulum autotrophicum HRM2]|uniref:Homocysteine S-methyltransferase n=1 Tax=Desulforapulum autotrophicum (strain ATCC 43914 / DSM 3382 / VKM B-1955 / HRM2) TaxID=177437 RepID=C0QE23_DESAH|nr:homocysteine S-methyltransferase family protein [Desulforapulum autotrophicum]ACN17444.1 homocysteine S-methyltransferase [Desulforapulum autotrophicum HRM2]